MAEPPVYPVTSRTELRRQPERGRHDVASVHAILDEGLVCHVGFVADGQPFVIPTAYARLGETLYLHGSPANRMLRTLEKDVPVCVTVTLLDGIVLARSAFHTSMNYRSVVVLGRAHRVRDEAERRQALVALVEHVAPGRSVDVRLPSDEELAFTKVLALPLREASAKVRSGPPLDDEADLALSHWAGVVPLPLMPGAPVPDPKLHAGVPAPEYVTGYRRPTPRGRDRGGA